ncbi:MAG: thioredoxin family protein [Leptospira sp.]|jgi:small redox-active disulfide protein 2|nr:thioredoxin family protein [Leptospira sp.]
MNIKVLGPGCKNCQTIHDYAQEAVKNLGITADIEYIKDSKEFGKYIMATPGLVINEEVVHEGKPLPSPDQVAKWIEEYK